MQVEMYRKSKMMEKLETELDYAFLLHSMFDMLPLRYGPIIPLLKKYGDEYPGRLALKVIKYKITIKNMLCPQGIRQILEDVANEYWDELERCIFFVKDHDLALELILLGSMDKCWNLIKSSPRFRYISYDVLSLMHATRKCGMMDNAATARFVYRKYTVIEEIKHMPPTLGCEGGERYREAKQHFEEMINTM